MEKAIAAPSRWHYAIGIGIITVGFVVFMVFLFTSLIGSIPEIQVVVPGEHELNLAESGKYTIFYERQSVVDNKIYSTGSVSGMLVKVESKDTSEDVTLYSLSMTSSYKSGGREGQSVLEFEIETPGTYILTADYDAGITGPELVLAIGLFDVSGTILQSLGIFLGSLAIGGFILIRTFVKRRKVKKQMMADMGWPVWGDR
ncbi:hypothetical protein ACFLWV_00590 [Chloroflexota bacterium]